MLASRMDLIVNSLFYVVEYVKYFEEEFSHPSYELGFPYDYQSLMHFSSHQYSKGAEPTITARLPSMTTLGNERGLSKQDVSMINSIYANCNGR